MTDKHFHPDGFVPMQNASANQEVEGFSTMANDIAALEKGIAFMQEVRTAFEVREQTPLTLQRINEIHNEVCGWGDPSNDEVEFARAIERAHGIV